jgi:signal transduction histidine kinase/CheY-like chemotaxis protein
MRTLTATATQMYLIVDDDDDIRDALTGLLELRTARCLQAATIDGALDALRANPDITACVLDMQFRNNPLAGLDVLKHLQTHHPALPVIIMTGFDESSREASFNGASLIIKKPILDYEHFLYAVEQTVITRQMLGDPVAKLRNDLRTVEGYVNALPVGVLVYDTNGVVQSMNLTMTGLIGAPNDAVGKPLREAFQGELFGDWHEIMEAWTSRTQLLEYRGYSYEVTTRPVQETGKTIVGYVQNWIDVTKRKRAEKLRDELPHLARFPATEFAETVALRLQQMGFPQIFVYERRPPTRTEGEHYCCLAAVGPDLNKALVSGHTISMDDPFIRKANRLGAAILLGKQEVEELAIGKPENCPRDLRRIVEMMKVPLLSAEAEPIGMICLERLDDDPDRFSIDDLELLNLLSRVIADALKSSILLPDTAARERWAEPMKCIVAALTASTQLDEILQTVLKKVSKAMRGNFGWVVQPVDEDAELAKPRLQAKAHWNDGSIPLTAEQVTTPFHPGGVGVTVRAMNSNQAQSVAALRTDSDFIQFQECIRNNTAWYEASKLLVSSVIIPIVRGDMVIGAMGIYFTKTFHATPADLENLDRVGTLLSVAMERVRFTCALEAKAAEASKVADVMLLGSGVAHSVRGFVQKVGGALDLAARNSDSTKIHAILGDVRSEVHVMRERVERIIRWVRPQGIIPRQVSLVEIIKELLDIVADQMKTEDVGVLFDVETGADIAYGPPDGLRMAILDLFVNAIRAMEGQSAALPKQIRIHIEPAKTAGEVELSISDTGPGMPANFLNVFQRFNNPHEPPTGGIGLGLYLAHRFITGCGGRITIPQSGSGGTTILVTLRTHGP